MTGYSEFDHHIQTVNGSKVFISDNFSATLTNDGSHLDSKLYPFDLMNTSLSPGVRKADRTSGFTSSTTIITNYKKQPN
ncbi:hypothetical protein [Nostoc sp.]|uniref:hypothetical protein n=1 Tax=Nostoc sp. TaxID=1180 RepID=UPI002FFCD086